MPGPQRRSIGANLSESNRRADGLAKRLLVLAEQATALCEERLTVDRLGCGAIEKMGSRSDSGVHLYDTL